MSRADREATAWLDKMMRDDAEDHRAEFERWVAKPANAAAYAEAKAVWNIAGGVSQTRIAALTRARQRAASGKRWAIAAILVAVIALGFATQFLGEENPAQLAVAPAAPSETQLADGTRVLLMDGARIEARFGESERRVVLTGGRARFHVAHDASRPFTVEAGGSETIALGTVFEVDLRQAAPRVSLIEGSVEVRASGRGTGLRLRPGESAEVQPTGPHLVAKSNELLPSALLDADRLPLGTVVERANRVNVVPIRLADPALGALRVTGRFDMKDSAALARKLAAALDLEVETTGDGPSLRAPVRS